MVKIRIPLHVWTLRSQRAEKQAMMSVRWPRKHGHFLKDQRPSPKKRERQTAASRRVPSTLSVVMVSQERNTKPVPVDLATEFSLDGSQHCIQCPTGWLGESMEKRLAESPEAAW